MDSKKIKYIKHIIRNTAGKEISHTIQGNANSVADLISRSNHLALIKRLPLQPWDQINAVSTTRISSRSDSNLKLPQTN